VPADHERAPRRIGGIAGLRAIVGTELGVSSWVTLTQATVDGFAEATGDRYWLHVDPVRAADTPFGGTIAHGLLTLGLGPRLSYEVYAIDDVDVVLNYGFDRVRFLAPVPVGSRVRMRAELTGLDESPGAAVCRIRQTFEVDGLERPACVAESLIRVAVSPDPPA
jgi:acyl dehydratase